MQRLDAYINGARHLPPAPTLVVELLGLFKQPDRDLDHVVDLLSHEPVLTAQVLRQCNSALFATAEPVVDMFEAISRLGFYEVYCIVAGSFGSEAVAASGKDCCLPTDQLWQHSVMAAVTAATISRRIANEDAAAFTSGLLHDMGKLVLASAECQAYGPLLKEVNGWGERLGVAEQGTFGVNHAQLGGRLLERWQLPPAIVAAVRFHHEPRSAGEYGSLAAVVHLADALAHHLDSVEDGMGESEHTPGESESVLGLTPDDVTTIVSESAEAFTRVRELMGVAN